MEYKNLLVEVSDSIATVIINRPEVLNALNAETIMSLRRCFRDFSRDDSVKAFILTGAGDKSFVAGADINELAKQTPIGGADFSQQGQAVFNLIESLQKPVVAAVNGFALGGGCELAMACHLRYAHEGARFGQPEVNLGIIPGYGGTQRLSRLVGKSRALELIMTGEMISAARAYEIGLVNDVFGAWKKDDQGKDQLDAKGKKVFDRDAFQKWVRDKLRIILSKGPVAVGLAIEAVNRGLEMTLYEGQKVESNLFGLVCTTEDFREGTGAFVEKRMPKFRGR
jgi:enoyl-CoA hydratase